MRRAARRRARRARVPGGGVRARDARVDDAARSATSCSAAPTTIRAPLRPAREGAARRDQGAERRRQNFAGSSSARRAPTSSRACARCQPALHRALAGDLRRLACRLRRLDVRRARSGAVGQRRLRRRRPDAHRAPRSLALVPRASRSTIGALGLRLIVPARARGAARARPEASRSPPASARSSRCRPGSRRSRCARRMRCSCRSAGSSTATCRRWRRRGSARRSSSMTLGFAFVLALVYLAWLLDRVAFLVPAFVLVARSSPAGSRSRATTPSTRLVVEDRARRLGAHRRGVALDRRRSRRWPGSLWFGAPELRRQAFLRFSRLATVLIALVLVGRHLPQHRPAAAPARSLDRAATARCCS